MQTGLVSFVEWNVEDEGDVDSGWYIYLTIEKEENKLKSRENRR